MSKLKVLTTVPRRTQAWKASQERREEHGEEQQRSARSGAVLGAGTRKPPAGLLQPRRVRGRLATPPTPAATFKTVSQVRLGRREASRARGTAGPGPGPQAVAGKRRRPPGPLSSAQAASGTTKRAAQPDVGRGGGRRRPRARAPPAEARGASLRRRGAPRSRPATGGNGTAPPARLARGAARRRGLPAAAAPRLARRLQLSPERRTRLGRARFRNFVRAAGTAARAHPPGGPCLPQAEGAGPALAAPQQVPRSRSRRHQAPSADSSVRSEAARGSPAGPAGGGGQGADPAALLARLALRGSPPPPGLAAPRSPLPLRHLSARCGDDGGGQTRRPRPARLLGPGALGGSAPRGRRGAPASRRGRRARGRAQSRRAASERREDGRERRGLPGNAFRARRLRLGPGACAGRGWGGAGGGAPGRGRRCRGWARAAARRGSAARRAPRVGRGDRRRPGVPGALPAAGPARQDGSQALRPRGVCRASSAAASPWGRCERQPRLRSGEGTVARASSLPKGRAPHCLSDRRVTDSGRRDAQPHVGISRATFGVDFI
ncbi:collagen alpha-1(I) chain-like [Manis pentadactyla]|uniref:collagen alpha-1(I) chain-like n=1 Tax=Manis pentadactyla TaxID=143292 RepID=UPI00255CC6BC|nr:collagen alpha-1(I) chain-like [Manis pentadactyla]